jgi:hypothetical protein
MSNYFICLPRYIEEVDLLRFFNKEEVDLVLPMFEGASETGKIKKSALRNWVVMEKFNAFSRFNFLQFQNLYYYYRCLLKLSLQLYRKHNKLDSLRIMMAAA